MRFRSSRLSGGCALVLFAAALQPAVAFEPSGSDVADALMKTLEATGAENVTYASVSSEGDSTTILGLSSAREVDGATNTIAAESVEITGGSVSGDGALSADDLTITGLTMAEEGDATEAGAEKASVTGLMLPAPGDIEGDTGLGSAAQYDSFAMEKVRFAEPGKPALTVDRVESQILERENGIATSGEIRVSEIKVPVEAFGDDDTSGAELKELGYDELDLSIYGKGGWNPETGQSTLDELRFEAKDMGELTVKLALGGVTQEVIDGLQQDQQDFNEMLSLLNNVTIENLSISYADDGLTARVLDQNAQEQGVDRQALIDELTGMLPMMLGALQNPEFEQTIAGAVTAFLNEPKTITIMSAPARPVPVAQIVGVAMMAPQTIPTMLSVTISANE